ncbi:MAG: cation diffusion facilitator family transporter [Lachnospiraceae bacterium]|nr:cation diffusion facilitator family transporter [Lachnospiraceae bacterium]
MLSGVKALIGLAVNSIAIILDAVNNLSDALSSIITIVGTKLSNKLPDRKHPLGHGRIEYLTSMIVAGIVLYAGITALTESVKKMIFPEIPEYNALSIIILIIAVVTKLILGLYVKKQGKRVSSGALVASGTDAMMDAVVSLSVLVSAVIYLIFHISLEALVGIFIAVMIIKAGLEMMTETLDEILGARSDRNLTDKIKALLKEEENVRGAYDLILYNYGPDKNYGSVHIEVPDYMTVKELDDLTRRSVDKVFKETGVILTGVGVYSFNTSGDEAYKMQEDIREILGRHEWMKSLHGFYLNHDTMTVRFDAVITFDIAPGEALKIIYKDLNEQYPDYEFIVSPDIDISD